MRVGIDGGEDGYHHCTVKKRAFDVDGTIEELTANVTAENLLAESSPEGNKFLFLEEIQDYQKGQVCSTPKQN